MRYINLIYPVEETSQESWARLRRICDMTIQATGCDLDEDFIGSNIFASWRRIAEYWADRARFFGMVDFMYEAIYHCCFNKFSESVHGSAALKLVLLIEDELVRCGVAFTVWRKLDIFDAAYWRVRSNWYQRKDSKLKAFTCFREYIPKRLEKRIFLKDVHPDNWKSYVKGGTEAYLEHWYDVWTYTRDYEENLRALISDVDSWYEEWCDADAIAKSIMQEHQVNFTNDFRSLNAFFEAVKNRKRLDICTGWLYKMSNAPTELLQFLWDDQYQEMIQRCFLSIYRRYRESNKKAHGHYRQSKVTENWIYKLVNAWYYDGRIKMIDGIQRALFDISMGF